MYSSHSQDPTRCARIENEKQGSRQSIMIQQGEADDVGVSPRPTEKPDARSWAHFVAGGIGGMTAATVTSPLDVLRTRLQSDFYQAQLRALRHAHPLPQSTSILTLPRSALLHFTETLQMLRSIHIHEGWRGLFKGLGPNLVGVVPARAISFYAYGNGKRLLNEYFEYDPATSPVGIHLTAAAMAGIATGTATNPIWLVKTRLQLDKANASNVPGRGRQYKNSWDCIKQTVRHEGIRGLYRGLSASYLGVTESTVQWVMYEQMKRILAAREARLLADPTHVPSLVDDVEVWVGKLFAAGFAKFFAAAATYPHEVVRTRLRLAPTVSVSGGKAQMKYTGLVQCFRLIFKEEGIAGLYGGLTPHLLRVVPSAAIMFGMYEVLLRLFGATA
ncbi:mitochondrial carrier protein [Histoplasma ohiense]|nr:mitochondrial carrier protein [Histoplasma ohiense (nom. inval.)]